MFQIVAPHRTLRTSPRQVRLSPRAQIIVGALLFQLHILAQQPVSFQYFYDDLNQLTRVVDSTGVAVEYVYDPFGNLLQINRSAVPGGALTIFSVTPLTVSPGATVTIQGQGFSTTPSANFVTIGGVAAMVISATSTTLVVVVPPNAISGVISVSVAGTTVTSASHESVVLAPTITTVSPKAALAGTTINNLTVTGANLSGAAFSFTAPIATISGVNVSADGTTATMTVAISPLAYGHLTIVATNGGGTSDQVSELAFLPSSVGNTLTVPGADPNGDPDHDELTNAYEIAQGTDPINADTDGDGYVDGLEVALNSNPLDALSVPDLQPPGFFVGSLLSIVNEAGGTPSGPTSQSFVGAVVSMLNQSPEAPTAPTSYAFNGSPFSMVNEASAALSGPIFYSFDGPAVSILNTGTPGLGNSTPVTFGGPLISIANVAGPLSAMPTTYTVASPSISVLNGGPPSMDSPAAVQAYSPVFSLLNGNLAIPSTAKRPIAPLTQASPLTWRSFAAEALARGIHSSESGGGCQDSDNDGICDADELILGTNPLRADTDGDGFPDGLELALGSDPLNPLSLPDIRPVPYWNGRLLLLQNFGPK